MPELSRARRFDRRALSFLSVLVIGMALFGCGSSSENDGGNDGEPSPQADMPRTTQAETRTEEGSETKPERARQASTAEEQSGSAQLDDAWTGEDDGDVTPEDRVAVAVERFYAAISSANSKRMCGMLSRRALAQTSGDRGDVSPFSMCRQSFSSFISRATKRGQLEKITSSKIRSVEIDGDRAVVKVRFGSGGLTEIPLVNERGSWKLDALRG